MNVTTQLTTTRAFGTNLDSMANATVVPKNNKRTSSGKVKQSTAGANDSKNSRRTTRSMSRSRARYSLDGSGIPMDSLATIGLGLGVEAFCAGAVEDIDKPSQGDPLAATQYVKELFSTYRAKEAATSTRPIFLAKQTKINASMRTILVDWLVDAHRVFKLHPETLYLAVNLLDRYLSRVEVDRASLQLVGISCLLIATKYEEVYCLAVADCVRVCDKAYPASDVLEMEWGILTTLQFDITVPTSYSFLSRFLKSANADEKTSRLANFLLDGTLQNYKLLQYLPSQLAAASVMIARKTTAGGGGRVGGGTTGDSAGTATIWTSTLQYYTGYSEQEVQPVARAVLKAWEKRQDSCRAVVKKHSQPKFGQIALVTLPSAGAV